MANMQNLCSHLNERTDEREGTIVCIDCGLVLSSYFFPEPTFQYIKYCHEMDEIKEYLERLNLPECFCKDIFHNFEMYLQKQNCKKKHLIPYCVYKTLNEIGFPVSIKDISAVSGVSENVIYDMQESENSIILDPTTLLEKYCKLLSLTDYQTFTLIKEKLPENNTGHNPLTIIASTIYTYCKKNNLKYSMRDIAKTVGISPVSIQRYIKKC